MSSFWAERLPASGYLNAVTLPASKRGYRKRIFAGSLSTHTGCSSGRRVRAAPFTLHVIHQQDQLPSHVIPLRATKSGVHTKAIPAIQLTGNFIATSVSICPWNTWDQSRAEPENSPV